MRYNMSVLRRQEWQVIVEEFEQSKLSGAEFCRVKNLHVKNFYNWCAKLKSSKSSKVKKQRLSVFVPVKIEKQRDLIQPQVAKALPDAKWAAEFAVHFVRGLL